MTRRQLLAAASAAVPAAAQRPLGPEPKARTRPIVCLYSGYLAKLPYTELGPVLLNLGFEGCDLAVRQGGHVLPEQAPVDLLRSIEEIRGAGVDVPMITTTLTSAMEPFARNVVGITGGMKVPFFRTGLWKYGAGDIDARLAEVRRDIIGLGSLGKAYGMAMGIVNETGGNVGQAVWDTRSLISDLDARWVGYCFDPCHAAAASGPGGWQATLRVALPRLKMLVVQDFDWAKEGGRWTMRLCPLGQGIVDWPAVFAALARSRFTGPVTLQAGYRPADEIAAVTRDLEFMKKHLVAAYGPVS